MGKPFKIGSYGAGTLSRISNQNGLFVLFNASPIAERLPSRCQRSLILARTGQGRARAMLRRVRSQRGSGQEARCWRGLD